MRKGGLTAAALLCGFSTAADALVLNITAQVTSGSSFAESGGVTQTTDLTGSLISLSLNFYDFGSGIINANYALQPQHHYAFLGITMFGPNAGGAELDGFAYDGGHFFTDTTTLSLDFAGTALFTNASDFTTFQPQNVLPAGSTLTATRQYTSFFPAFPDPITSSGGYQIQARLLSINANAVPEPTAWALLIGGFGVIGAAMRRRPRVRVRFA